jgi:hypothetical protein
VKAFDPVGMKQAGKATNNHGSEIIFSKDRLAHYPYILFRPQSILTRTLPGGEALWQRVRVVQENVAKD